MTISKQSVEAHFAEVSMGLNESIGLMPGYDQSKGNRCDALTLAVMNRLGNGGGAFPRRELHQNEHGDWHYILAHEPVDAEPSDDDLMSDLNPWQWGGRESGLLHMPRGELLDYLADRGAPDHFIALRAVETIVKAHDTRTTPFTLAS